MLTHLSPCARILLSCMHTTQSDQRLGGRFLILFFFGDVETSAVALFSLIVAPEHEEKMRHASVSSRETLAPEHTRLDRLSCSYPRSIRVRRSASSNLPGRAGSRPISLRDHRSTPAAEGVRETVHVHHVGRDGASSASLPRRACLGRRVVSLASRQCSAISSKGGWRSRPL